MRRRWLIIPPLTLAASLCSLELAARALALDTRQSEAIAFSSQHAPREVNVGEGDPAWLQATRELDLPYLPRGFQLHDDGFENAWGRCSFSHPGPTILALGDSTTYETRPLTGRSLDHLQQHTWPAYLGQRLGDAVQICVLAEVGYHPSDLAELAAWFRERRQPDLVIALLCDNDLHAEDLRRQVIRGDRIYLYSPPSHWLIWQPARVDWLLARSEAFRFLHWRMALVQPAHSHRLPRHVPAPTPVGQALNSLGTREQVLLFYLPLLVSTAPDRPEALRQLEGQLIAPVTTVDLPGFRAIYRNNPDEDMHLNSRGHAQVTGFMEPYVRAALPQISD